MKAGDKVKVIGCNKASWVSYIGRTGYISKMPKEDEDGVWFQVILDKKEDSYSGPMSFVASELEVIEEGEDA